MDINTDVSGYRSGRVNDLAFLLKSKFGNAMISGDDDFEDGSFMLEILFEGIFYLVVSESDNRYGISINIIEDSENDSGIDSYRFLYFKHFTSLKDALFLFMNKKQGYDSVYRDEKLKMDLYYNN